MKKYIYICLLMLISFSFSHAAEADAKFQLERVNNIENLPRVEINTTMTTEKEFKSLNKKVENNNQKVKPTFNPKKNSGMTNYQYDDSYYKYNKCEKFIKDNIEYSKSGSTKLY